MRPISKVEISKEILNQFKETEDVAEITVKVNELAKKGLYFANLNEKTQFFIENIFDFAKKTGKESEISAELENTLKEFYLKLVSEY